MEPLSQNNFANSSEQYLPESCSEFNAKYILPATNENQEQRRNRRQQIRRDIAEAKLKNKSQEISHTDAVQPLLKSCSEFNVKYIKPSKNENQQQYVKLLQMRN